ncbi:MAG: adenylyltransferase/cytidyltransferase family protein [Kiritimatiellae bacterium]|nr:adenylyltransferase/cytidyltransferase family protein [Kiritimatiellia bacterium]
MKTGITFGTFDMFHYGHLRILQRSRALCDRLVVGVASDEFNMRKDKHRVPVVPWEQRAAIVAELKCVDEVFKEDCEEKKADYIREHGADVFIIGADYEGRFDWLEEKCGVEVVYLPRTPGVSTTDLISKIKS